MSEDPKQEGKISSLITAFKKLLAEDPLLFIIAITCLAPLGIGIVTTALEGDYMLVAILVMTMAAVILFIVIPLIITRTWKINQREVSGKQQKAIDTEAKIRLINARNKHKRFNDVTDAKIESLKAQTQFILDQSDRHERLLLKQISEDLGKHYREGLPFVDKEECAVNVSKLLQEFNKIHIDYDEVYASITRIEKALNIVQEEPPVIKIVKDPEQQNWAKIAEVRQNIIEDQLKELDVFEDKIGKQSEVIQKLENELNKLDGSQKSRIIEVPSDQEAVLSPSPLPFPQIGFAEEPSEKELGDHLQKQIDDEPIPETIDQEIDKHLKELEEEPPKNYWTCKYCNNDNPLKTPRCKKCGKGKVQPSS